MKAHSRRECRINLLVALIVSASGLPAQDTITTIAGDGPNNVSATLADLAYPDRVLLDKSGNMYISASLAHRVYRVDPAGEQVS